jgi:hypothetical protein
MELLPPPTESDSTLPPCRLRRTETELIIAIGDRDIQRFRHRAGANIVEVTDRFDKTLLTAMRTVNEMRAAGVCR